MTHWHEIPGLGRAGDDLIALNASTDGIHHEGRDGVVSIHTTVDRQVEFIAWPKHALAYVRSALGYPAYYPLRESRLRAPLKAVLMDLDGTSVRSESFWIWMIQCTVASLLDHPRFEFEDTDAAHVSGHSVSEHLAYAVQKYCPQRTVEEARLFTSSMCDMS